MLAERVGDNDDITALSREKLHRKASGACKRPVHSPRFFSFPSSAWERSGEKLCCESGPDAKRSFADRRSQTEFGNEDMLHQGVYTPRSPNVPRVIG